MPAMAPKNARRESECALADSLCARRRVKRPMFPPLTGLPRCRVARCAGPIEYSAGERRSRHTKPAKRGSLPLAVKAALERQPEFVTVPRCEEFAIRC